MEMIPVYNISGEKVNEVSLPDTISKVKLSIPVMHEVVTAHLNNQRKGSASTKTRSEVRGGGAKPWRQKGTGRARAGSIRSPLWRKGGIIFGPKPRSYKTDLPDKKKQIALKMALKSKYIDNKIVIMNDIILEQPKTNKLLKIINKIIPKIDKVLLVVDKIDDNLKLASRNIEGLKVIQVNFLNTYEVLNSKNIIFTESAFNKIS
jgi:large subunit ribosomal protein L4